MCDSRRPANVLVPVAELKVSVSRNTVCLRADQRQVRNAQVCPWKWGQNQPELEPANNCHMYIGSLRPPPAWLEQTPTVVASHRGITRTQRGFEQHCTIRGHEVSLEAFLLNLCLTNLRCRIFPPGSRSRNPTLHPHHETLKTRLPLRAAQGWLACMRAHTRRRLRSKLPTKVPREHRPRGTRKSQRCTWPRIRQATEGQQLRLE